MADALVTIVVRAEYTLMIDPSRPEYSGHTARIINKFGIQFILYDFLIS